MSNARFPRPSLISEDDFTLFEEARLLAQHALETRQDKALFIEKCSPLRARAEYMLYDLEMKFKYAVAGLYETERTKLKSAFSSTMFRDVALFMSDATKEYALAYRYLTVWTKVISQRIIDEQSVIKYFERET